MTLLRATSSTLLASTLLACVNVDAPTACQLEGRCGDATSSDAPVDAVDSGSDAIDGSTETGDGDGGSPCTAADECKTGDTRTVVGSCPAVGDVKQQLCSACKWLPAACVPKKGWRVMAAPPGGLVGRSEHAGAWTGTDLVVYGGIGTSGALSLEFGRRLHSIVMKSTVAAREA